MPAPAPAPCAPLAATAAHPAVPADYARWQAHARALLEPLAALMVDGRASLPLPGRPSDHDAQADRLESFARPLFRAASEPKPANKAPTELDGSRPACAQAWRHAFAIRAADSFGETSVRPAPGATPSPHTRPEASAIAMRVVVPPMSMPARMGVFMVSCASGGHQGRAARPRLR